MVHNVWFYLYTNNYNVFISLNTVASMYMLTRTLKSDSLLVLLTKP